MFPRIKKKNKYFFRKWTNFKGRKRVLKCKLVDYLFCTIQYLKVNVLPSISRTKKNWKKKNRNVEIYKKVFNCIKYRQNRISASNTLKLLNLRVNSRKKNCSVRFYSIVPYFVILPDSRNQVTCKRIEYMFQLRGPQLWS